MNKLKARRMKCDTGDEPLRRFRGVVFSVTDNRVADGGELHPNLILQSRYQGNPDERGAPKMAINRIAKFRARRIAVPL